MGKRGSALLVAAGVLGPVLFWLVVIIDGATKPGYDARRHFISELALGERGWVQSTNFIVVGVLTIAFAAGLRRLFPTGRASIFGPLLVGFVGLGLAASGVFRTDPANYPVKADAAQGTTSGAIHGLAFVVVVGSVIAACFVLARRFRQEPTWRGYGMYSVITGILVPAWLVVLVVAGDDRPYTGLLQRALVATFFGWLAVIAARAVALETRAEPAGAGTAQPA